MIEIRIDMINAFTFEKLVTFTVKILSPDMVIIALILSQY